MKNIVTIFRKQLKETMRNKEVLIQFLMFPVLAVFMTKSIQIEGMPPNFFVQLFSTMYVGMAPLVSMEAILSEEKEKNTQQKPITTVNRDNRTVTSIPCRNSWAYGAILEKLSS